MTQMISIQLYAKCFLCFTAVQHETRCLTVTKIQIGSIKRSLIEQSSWVTRECMFTRKSRDPSTRKCRLHEVKYQKTLRYSARQFYYASQEELMIGRYTLLVLVFIAAINQNKI